MDEKQRHREVSEILHLWVKTFGLMKIFTDEHENVRKFTSQLFGRLKDYMEQNFNLEVGIQEFSFTFDGKPVYTDNQSGSLPFFFYKDGMAALYFNRGLRKKEFLEFLEIVKRESGLPPEESDIVSAFWERDFANIRYFAPDEFLESQIGQDVEIVEYVVDRERLYKGRINLLPEDQKALFNGESLTESILEAGSAPVDQNVEKGDGAAGDEVLFSPAEEEALQEMLRSHRQNPVDGELNALLLEILYLEDNPANFGRTLDVLQESHRQYVTEGDFAQADDILVSLNELNQDMAPGQAEKLDHLGHFWDRLRQDFSPLDIRNSYDQARVRDYESLFSYLGHVGPSALPLVGFLYSETKSPRYQEMARDILRDLGRSAPDQLLDMAQNSRPDLTLEIIRIIEELADPRVSPRLAGFLNSPNPGIQKSAIQALGHLRDPRSVRLLAACLQDTDENIRILALRSLKGTKDETTISRILSILKDKSFHTQSRAEKQAVLDFLAGTSSRRSLDALGALIRKVGRFSRPRRIETGLLAISALGKSGNPKAAEALEKGGRSSNPRLKKKCRDIYDEVNPT